MYLKRGAVRDRCRRAQRGVGLIEALIALMILAIGLLGSLVMQSRGLQLNQAGYYQSQAMFMASDMIERIRANRSAVERYEIALGVDGDAAADACADVDAACSDAEIADADVLQWKTALARALPEGDGEVAVAANGDLFTVTVEVQFVQGELHSHLLEVLL